MPEGDIYMATIWERYQDNDNAHIFCVNVENETVQAQSPVEIDNWLHNDVLPLMKPLKNEKLVFRCSNVQQVWGNLPSPGPKTSLPRVTPFIAQTGSRDLTAAAPMPGQLSLVAQLITDQDNPTSRNRGRDFWYAMLQGDMDSDDGDRWDAAFQLEVITFYTSLTSNFSNGSGNTYSWGVFSRTQAVENANPDATDENGIPNSEKPTFGDPYFQTATKVRINPMIRTQRRRQPLDPCKVYIDQDIPI